MLSQQLNIIFISIVFCITTNAFAQKNDKPQSVIVQALVYQNIQNDIEAIGSLHAYNSILLTSKTTKIIERIYFEDGQRVKKGDALIDMAGDEDMALMQEARIHAAESRKQFERIKSLSNMGAISIALLDQNKREYEAANARLSAINARLKDLHITAPFDGVMGVREVSVGSLISPGQTIGILNDDSKMKLDFSVPAVHLQSLNVGLPIEVLNYDLGTGILNGTILSIDNQIDEQTRSIKVRAILNNTSKNLKQGMLMNVILHSNQHKSLVLSEAALVPMGSNNFVFLVKVKNSDKNTEWIAVKRQIQIGRRYPGFVEVLSGLDMGDKVVTHGLQKISDGQPVAVLAEQSNDMTKPNEPLSELLKQKHQ